MPRGSASASSYHSLCLLVFRSMNILHGQLPASIIWEGGGERGGGVERDVAKVAIGENIASLLKEGVITIDLFLIF